ncbi:DUF3145 family protein [Tropheryma whipplei]|uniref:DUF3145 family protein n=1 Tax=Tropheryma whipplei TaxID=2039 RepID=UPI0006857F7B|nr:DUF3145 family protein [Tropheryma whipplei]
MVLPVSGYVFIHSAPRFLCTHLSWAVSSVLSKRVDLAWTCQPFLAGTYRSVYRWVSDKPGTGAALAAVLRSWDNIRFEVTENCTADNDGARWLYTPELGIHYAQTDSAGNIVLTENRLQDILTWCEGNFSSVRREINFCLGNAWDEQLEPYRSSAGYAYA